MDRSWMSGSRLSKDYVDGIKYFCEYVRQYIEVSGESLIFCPCMECWNGKRVSFTDLKLHLNRKGINPRYRVWHWHGELTANENLDEEEEHNEDGMDGDDYEQDQFVELLNHIHENLADRPELFDQLKSDAEKPLYPNCTRFTKLSAVLKLFRVKAGNGWSDKSFNELLELLTLMLPDDNILPKRTYDARKVMRPLGLDYTKIHACPNDCILYRGPHKALKACPECQMRRYAVKQTKNGPVEGGPVKTVWYLPIIPRFQRLFGNPIDADNLTWHGTGSKKDNKIRHPSDARQWKRFNFDFPSFGHDHRNLRLGLITDGINPFGTLSSQHSTWPVLLVIYNLPPWLTMKRRYVMLSVLISGPRQPGNDIDVYLAPLIDDLKLLWDTGMLTFDAHLKKSFMMRAMLLCTINDFPAHGNLSGYRNKGYEACPTCLKDTHSIWLKHSRKNVYLGHRRFLRRNHPYRRNRKDFNDLEEHGEKPQPPTGEQIWNSVCNIQMKFGKSSKSVVEGPWKKKSIFFELPYWMTLAVRQVFDVMHMEKNTCESVIGTLLNTPGKTKDGVNSRLDLVDLNIRPKLYPQIRGNRTFLPPACYTMSKAEKIKLCSWLRDVKVPSGYSSNVRSLVSMQDLKLIGLKSHDCHTLMQQILPVAIRGVLPDNVRKAITRLCFFFGAICKKEFDLVELDLLEEEIADILCQLEMYFQPSFFDIMIHLCVHVVREIRELGPVFLTWMYPGERHMKVLKGYVRNRFRPEGCIVEGYIAEELIDFCTDYLGNTEMIGIPKPQNPLMFCGFGKVGCTHERVTLFDRLQAHFYVLEHMEEVKPFVHEHLVSIKTVNQRKSSIWVQKEHCRTFTEWFKNKVVGMPEEEYAQLSKSLQRLSLGPKEEVFKYQGYDVNGYSFYTKTKDLSSVVQNSGVSIESETVSISSAKDKFPRTSKIVFHGVIQEIWELDYSLFKIAMFKCTWFDSNHVKPDKMGFLLADMNKVAHSSEPFILAQQATQVFYLSDPSNARLSVVLKGKRHHNRPDRVAVDIDNVEDIEPVSHTETRPTHDTQLEDGDVYVRNDHEEGEWFDNDNIPMS